MIFGPYKLYTFDQDSKQTLTHSTQKKGKNLSGPPDEVFSVLGMWRYSSRHTHETLLLENRVANVTTHLDKIP